MKVIIDTDVIKNYIENNEVDAIVFNGINLNNLVIDGAEFWSSSPFKYELLSDGTYSIVGCSSNISGDVVIPETYNGVAVTAIDDEAFANRTAIISITIPESITYIGSYAMYNSATTLNFEHLYWKTIDRTDGAVTYGTSDAYMGSADFEWHKFYAPEIALTHEEDFCVNVTVKNNNDSSLQASIHFYTDESWNLNPVTINVPANGTSTTSLDYTISGLGFDAFDVYACFTVFESAKSDTITIEYSYWPDDEADTI